MAAISVRDLADQVVARLKVRAARHGRSMEAEVRAILADSVASHAGDETTLAQAIRRRFSAIGGADLDVPSRKDQPRAAELP